MSVNVELFREIREIISTRQGVFSMASWEGESTYSECGTTRCLAGWAIHLATGEPLYRRDVTQHPSVIRLAEERGVALRRGPGEEPEVDFEKLGANLLGLPEAVAERVFYVDDHTATAFVDAVVDQGEEEAIRVLENELGPL